MSAAPLGFDPDARLLITTDDWFFGPDGNSYKAAWGRAVIVPAVDVLGFKPANSTNWMLRVGDGDRALLIMGCRIHYVAIAPTCVKRSDIYFAEAL